MSQGDWITEKSLEADLSALMIPASEKNADQAVTLSGGQGASSPVSANLPKMRRAVHVSTISALALSLPSALYSLMCLMLVGGALSLGREGLAFLAWLLPLLWFAGGVSLFYRPVETVFVRRFMGVRQPTASELQLLLPMWERVADRAGIDPGTFVLGMEDSHELNASAAAGHSVTVTTGALTYLEDRQLEAVLAHELGHHLGGHPVAALWNYWVALPGRFLNRAVVKIYRFFNAIVRIFSVRGWIISLLFVALMGVALVMTAPWLLLVLLVPVALAAVSRASEVGADRIAVHLGYGPALVEVLEIFESLEAQSGGVPQTRFAGWTESHPSPRMRIHKIVRLTGNA